MSRSFFRTMNLFFILPIAVSSYTEEDHNSKIAVSLTTEGSWNPVDGKANWENYVNVNAQTRLWKGAMAQVGILASQNTRIGRGKSWTVLDDPQSFSNIQTDKQVPFSPALVGITQHITDRFSVFVGVRNMNGDYFTTPFTGLFINSSYGIFPTIADNWNIANYPEASFCLHFEGNISDHITLKNSFYNGRASNHWNETFRFRPSKDGWADVFEIGYATSSKTGNFAGEYHLGVVSGYTPHKSIDYGNYRYYNSKFFNWSIYSLIEQPLFSGRHPLGLLVEGGYAPKHKNDTYLYIAAGIVWANLLRQNDVFGLSINRSLYRGNENENCMELTYSLPVMSHFTVQPAMQFFCITGESHIVALLRARIDL